MRLSRGAGVHRLRNERQNLVVTGPASTYSASLTKAAFVRSQPRDMPAKDVVAKGAEAKIKLTDDYVYSVRSNAKKAKGKKPSAGGKKSVSKTPTTPKTKGKAPEKKNRVLELRAQNPDWSATQIALAAKCSTATVYAALGGSKESSRGSATVAAKTKSPVMQHLDHVRALRGVILHVGIDRAKEMMDQIVKDLMI